MTLRGFFDCRELADVMDVRASTIRQLAAINSELIPDPVYFKGLSQPLWPEAAIECWVKQGSPACWQYSESEFTAAALGHLERFELARLSHE